MVATAAMEMAVKVITTAMLHKMVTFAFVVVVVAVITVAVMKMLGAVISMKL